MGLVGAFRFSSFARFIQRLFGKKHARIGIYGPPNVGKTTLANRIARDLTGEIVGSVSEIPHETRRAKLKRRAKEATEGVIEAIRWLDDLDGVVLVMDSTEDPFTQVNVTILGNLEARSLPVLIAANKIDVETASPATLKSAFPQHPVVPISALTGHNIDTLYTKMVEHFGSKRRRKAK